MTKLTIEELWSELRAKAPGAQRRVDATHPLDLYADFEHPDRPGLVLVSEARPPDSAPLKSIGIERRQRHDGLWTLRVYLEEPRLLPVFAELCRDIIEFTVNTVDRRQAPSLVLSRIERWKNLMQTQPAGLDQFQLRGLIGELVVLERRVIPEFGLDSAISAWTGPLGTPQDFQLPTGTKLEVKALNRDADRVRINGLGQLDSGNDPLHLVIVRLENTGTGASDAITPSKQVARMRTLLSEAPSAIETFEILLRFIGWDDSRDTDSVAVRVNRIDLHEVNASFPRLIPSTVPNGVVEASYVVVLPPLPMNQ